MKKYAKHLKEYDKVEFDPKEIIEGMSRLKGTHRKPTSVALEEELLKDLWIETPAFPEGFSLEKAVWPSCGLGRYGRFSPYDE